MRRNQLDRAPLVDREDFLINAARGAGELLEHLPKTRALLDRSATHTG